MPMVWAAARHQWGVVKLMKVAGVRSGGLFLFQLRRLAYPDVLNTSRAHRGQLGAQKGGMYASCAQRVASLYIGAVWISLLKGLENDNR